MIPLKIARYAYSNLGYLVLGQVIERISGQQHILEVLDMHRTGFWSDHQHDCFSVKQGMQ